LGRAGGELSRAERDATESEAIFRELGDRWGLLKATNSLAELAEISGDYDRAICLHRDGLRMAEELGLWGEASLRLSGLGRIALLQKDFDTAEELHTRAMRLAAEQGNKPAEEFAELGLGLGARRAGQLDKAEHHLRRWLDWLRQLPAQPGVPLVLAELGFIAEQRGDSVAALELQTEGLTAAQAVGDPRALALAYEGLAGAHALASELHSPTSNTAQPERDAADAASGAGEPEREPGNRTGEAEREAVEARRLLGEAGRLRLSVGAPLPAAERFDVDRIRARLAATEPAGRSGDLGHEAATSDK
jgi:tetratricopeptide (TPR) repeat protein